MVRALETIKQINFKVKNEGPQQKRNVKVTKAVLRTTSCHQVVQTHQWEANPSTQREQAQAINTPIKTKRETYKQAAGNSRLIMGQIWIKYIC